MALNDTLIDVPGSLISEVGKIGLWMQTLGLVVILWLFFEIVAFFINRKRMKEVYAIKHDMKRIERKIDQILASKSKK